MNLFQSGEDLWEQVAKKFNKTIKSLDEDVALLQEWLKTQPHLPDLLDSNCLRNFLILNKFSVEVAKQKIDNYFTLRLKFEEVYGSCNPKLDFNEAYCKSVFTVPGPKLTKELYRIGFFKFKDEHSVELFEPLSHLKRLVTMQDMRLRRDVMYGDIICADFKGLSISVLAKVTPSLVYRTLALYEGIYSIHLKAFYIINLPSYGISVLSLLKKTMKPKIFDRIHILEDVNEIKEFLPSDVVPEDFGGEGPSLASLEESLNELYEENSELFSHLDEMTIYESLRPEKLEEDVFGVYGNFKKIDVD